MNGVTVDVSEFQGAMREYLRMTSKSTSDALNGKAKDLALRAAQRTPKSAMTAAEFNAQQTNPEFVGAVARRIYERRGGAAGGQSYQRIYERTQGTMALKKFGKGFMKSGFVKAAKKFRKTADASTAPRQDVPEKFTKSNATAKTATEKSLSALFDVSWDAKGTRDAGQKQAIVSKPMAQAVRFVVADIRKYIEKKQEQHAKKITATAARSILKAFR